MRRRRRFPVIIAAMLAIASGCGGSGSSGGEIDSFVDVATTLPVDSTTTTAAPTPAELLVGCLEGSIIDEVVCAGARVIVLAENGSVAAALDRFDTCVAAPPTEGCAAEQSIVVRAVRGEDVSAELGPGPDEVWPPDVDSIAALVTQLGQANDVAGLMGAWVVYAASSEPSLGTDPMVCLGEYVDQLVSLGDPIALLATATETNVADLTVARRTDDWTAGSNAVADTRVELIGRTYAFPLTSVLTLPGEAPIESRTEVHVHIGTDGHAYAAAGCTPGYQIANPEATTATMAEILRRLDEAGIWQPHWTRPAV